MRLFLHVALVLCALIALSGARAPQCGPRTKPTMISQLLLPQGNFVAGTVVGPFGDYYGWVRNQLNNNKTLMVSKPHHFAPLVIWKRNNASYQVFQLDNNKVLRNTGSFD